MPPQRTRKAHEGWNLVRTRLRMERTAQHNAQAQGCETFLPRVRHGPGRLEPLFPNYLFVRRPDAQWLYLKGTIGVATVLMHGGKPALVPRRVMRDLMRDQGREGFVDLGTDATRLQSGDNVQVERTAFRNQKGVYIAPLPGERVRVLLQFMGVDAEVELKRADISKA